MRRLCATLTIAVAGVILGILCNDKASSVAGDKLKYHERTSYQFKLPCVMTPSDVEQLLDESCTRKRKRNPTDEGAIQSSEEARSFLGRLNREYITNYDLFMEECCMEGCRTEEALEHC